MDLAIGALQVTQGRVEVHVTLLSDEGVALGVNLLRFTGEWGNAMAKLLPSLVLPHIEELYLKHGVPVNRLGEENETWQALVPQLSQML